MGSFCMKVGTKGSLFRVTQFLVKTTSLVAEPSLRFPKLHWSKFQ